jgi:HIP---CoA ligase
VTDTIAGELAAAAAECPDRTWLTYAGDDVTFAAMHGRVRAAARALVGLGVRRGDRVAVWAPNTIDAAIALLAVPTAGAVVVPLNTRYRSREVAEIAAAAAARLVLTPGPFLGRDYTEEARTAVTAPVVALDNLVDDHRCEHELVARIAAQVGEDVAVVQYTSGTTGRPKGAVLRQGPMLATARTWSAVVGLGPDDLAPITYPLAHVGGFKTGLLTTLSTRARAVLFPVVDRESLITAITRYRPSVLSAPPPVLRTLLDAVRAGALHADTGLRTVITGSAIVPALLVRELIEQLGVQDVINGYGLTEATGVCTMTRRGDTLDVVCETIGRPIDGVEVRVASPTGVGEIEVRGANIMLGYLDDPAATAEVMHDGWLRTGDVGHIDDSGYVHISGRAKDMVIVGGFNVYPPEVEQVLSEHPSVSDAAAVGVPDERLGEVVVAFVVPAAGGLDVEDLTSWCRERLANYKVPRIVWAVTDLPRGAVGKVAKEKLRARAVTALRNETGPPAV